MPPGDERVDESTDVRRIAEHRFRQRDLADRVKLSNPGEHEPLFR